MRSRILIVSILQLLFCGGWSAQSETTNTALRFFVVSQEKVEGGRFIDTPELPNVGYIAAKLDLVVTTLQDVSVSSKNPPDSPPALSVTLQPEDARRFANLTKKSIGKRLLLMLGDKPLTAPRVMSTLEGGRFLIRIRRFLTVPKDEAALFLCHADSGPRLHRSASSPASVQLWSCSACQVRPFLR